MHSPKLHARQFIVAYAGFVCLTIYSVVAHADDAKKPRFPQLQNKDALSRLGHKEPQLPAWAQVLATPLPNTTIAMLRLDYLHRVNNPLNKTLRAKIRWAAADAIGCQYGKQTAIGDLQRTGLSKKELKQFSDKGDAANADEKAAIAFARKLTTAGHSVTDKEFEDLINRFGAKNLVAIVHTVAHANFQDRIFLSLGVQVEKDGPVPPWQPAQKNKRTLLESPARSAWNNIKSANQVEQAPDWSKHSFDDLQKALQSQQKRNHRFALLKKKAEGDTQPPRGSSPILWNQVGMMHQPEMTRAWFDCLNVFSQEGDLDRVVANSMFWVVTRSNECFY